MHLALHPSRSRTRAPDTYAAFDPLAAAADLAASLAAPGLRHGRPAGPGVRHPVREGDWIRASGLLPLSVPREHGGGGASWQAVLDVVRIVARADAALARLLGLHHLQIATVQLYANPHRRHRLLAASVAEEQLWSDGVDPLDRGVVATPVAGGYVLNGTRVLAAAAAIEADWLTVSAWDPLARAPIVAVLPTAQPGVAVQPDGTVRFDGVLLPEEHVLQSPGQRLAPQAALRAQAAALVDAGIAAGSAEAAHAGAHDGYPFGRSRPGAAQALADAAARLDFAFACGADLDAAERAALAAAVDRAAALAHGADAAALVPGVAAHA